MNVKKMMAGYEIPTLSRMANVAAEFLLDREESTTPAIREKLIACMRGQNLQDWADFVDMVYATRQNCGPITLTIAANVAVAFALNRFLGRAEEMDTLALILKREAGGDAPSGITWPAPENDPPAKAEFMAAQAGASDEQDVA